MKVIRLPKEVIYRQVAKEYDVIHERKAKRGCYINKWLGNNWFDIGLYNSICRKYGLI